MKLKFSSVILGRPYHSSTVIMRSQYTITKSLLDLNRHQLEYNLIGDGSDDGDTIIKYFVFLILFRACAIELLNVENESEWSGLIILVETS